MAAASTRMIFPVGASALLHVSVVGGLILMSARSHASMPPIYSVELIAAPAASTAAIGVEAPSSPTPVAPAPRTRDVVPPLPVPNALKVLQRTTPVRATPTPANAKAISKAAPAVAKGGPTGGSGADVANVRTEGIEFPFPGYLNNIVRQVALNFAPGNVSADLHAEVAFLIRRDGTVAGFRFITRSNDYAFDLEAQGAIEKAGPSFGPLPDGFHDDVLPVVFSFDPRLIH